MKDKFRTIRVEGSKQTSTEIERWKEFCCFGQTNVKVACEKCRIRFKCLTESDVDYVLLPISDFNEESLKHLDVKKFCKIIVPEVKYYIVKTNLTTNKAVIDFKENK